MTIFDRLLCFGIAAVIVLLLILAMYRFIFGVQCDCDDCCKWGDLHDRND